MKRMTLAIFATLLTMASTTFGATQNTGTNTIAPQLQISVTIQKAVRLTLATGTAAVTHCAVVANGQTAPEFSMNFGTVDALGINAGNCNLFGPANAGVDNAIYWTDYNILPVYTSQSVNTATVTAQVTTDFGGGGKNLLVVRDSANSNTVPTAASSFTAMGTASADTIVSSGTISGSTQTRFIGVAVKPDNGATALTGNQSATVTFTLTVQ